MENESGVKARFVRNRRVGPKYEVFNRREAVPVSFSMGWHGQRYWLACAVHFSGRYSKDKTSANSSHELLRPIG